ncbi:helix-turn-helix domain-containing protein [Streptomyces sp. NPDC058718]|uniref:helix-turn-helix domain-containing protein n=1 Tax=Streptomyces sp. NPDC058718 TaxID=3346610 RepID=UPI0036BC30FE
MDTSEVAAMLNMSTSWVYREASKLGLKGYKLGRGKNAKVLYKRAEVFRWLEQQKIY